MPTGQRYALILAGGRGTRFWPRSRKRRAKQVLDFTGGGSLIQQTVRRLAPLVPASRIWVLTNDYLAGEIRAQLPEVPAHQILAEPAQRNTAPAIGLAARILHELDPDAVMGVFPSDHFIARPGNYLPSVDAAYAAAESGAIGLLGIQPRYAETGFGYVEFPPGAVVPGSTTPVPVARFREKPDLATAESFVAAGNFAWNAGMFFWRCDVLLDALERHRPTVYEPLSALPSFHDPAFAAALATHFPRCENVSIDYAVLEPARGVVGFAAGDIGWSDLGSWTAVYELTPHDAAGNGLRSDTLLAGAASNFVDAGAKLVALLGVQNLIVVDTPDALLIADRSRAQEVGDLVKQLERQGREDLL